ncbi:MAG TPA: PDZ domain-containing protein [Longimicrobium sp.]|jgi:predicted metalloprotease with PDZ domain
MRLRAFLVAAALAAGVLPAAAAAQVEGRTRAGAETFVYVQRAWLGIRFSWEEEGDRQARVAEVMEGSPAERAGVRAGDVVLSIDGRPATEEAVDDLREGLDEGDRVRLRLRRDGREWDQEVVAARPSPRIARGFPRRPDGDRTIIIEGDSLRVYVDSLRQHLDSLRVGIYRRHGDSVVIRIDSVMGMMRDSLVRAWPRVMREMPEFQFRMREGVLPFFYEFGPRSLAGAEFAEMNEGLGRYFRTSEGLLVLKVAPESPAARAGLEAGDVVVRANGRAVEDIGDLREAFTGADERTVRVEVVRQGARRTLEIRWERPERRPFRELLPDRRRPERERPRTRG